MSKIVWDDTGSRFFETGVDQGVLYVHKNGAYGTGIAWNGLTAVTESPEGAELTDLWADNMKYASIRSAENFKATIEAYTYPDEFMECDGSAELVQGVTIGQQTRSKFGLCYSTKVGNDVDGDNKGYKIHLIYGATASPSEKAYQTVNDSPDAITFSWEVETTPVNVKNYKPTATLVIDSTKVEPTKLAKVEAALYGDENAEPKLLLPDEVLTLLS